MTAATLQHCIETCRACDAACSETVIHCFKTGGSSDHARLLLDCAQVCATSAGFMLRGSPLHPILCRACAEVCERCAEACERAAGDERMQRCAAACRACAESCDRMASVAIR